jgi:hypothetical protein
MLPRNPLLFLFTSLDMLLLPLRFHPPMNLLLLASTS